MLRRVVPFLRQAESTAAKAAAGGIPDKISLSLTMPHDSVFAAESVDQVTIPANSGIMGVLPGHVPTLAELKPGVVEVKKSDGSVEKYFVSGGFAMIQKDSAVHVNAVEAFALEDLDSAAVASGLEKCQQALSSAADDEQKAIAQIGIDVHEAMKTALEGSKN